MKIYYKVVREGRSWNDKKLVYPPLEEVVAPEGTKLFIFDSLSNLLEMMRGFNPEDCTYWECTAKNVSRPKYMASCNLAEFWRKRKNGSNLSDWYGAERVFKGTLFCDSLTLTKKIYEDGVKL